MQRVVKISTCFIGLPLEERLTMVDYQLAQDALIKAAGFASYTSLRADSFSSNALRWKHAIAGYGTVKWMLVDAAYRHVAPEDIAEVAADALATHDYDHVEAVTIQGPELLSTRQQIDIMARVLGRPIQLVEQSRAEYTAEHGAYVREMVIQAIWNYEQYRLQHPDAQAKTDKLVTGKVTFEQFMEKNKNFLEA